VEPQKILSSGESLLQAELSTAIGGRNTEASGGREEREVRKIVRDAGGEAMGDALLVK